MTAVVEVAVTVPSRWVAPTAFAPVSPFVMARIVVLTVAAAIVASASRISSVLPSVPVMRFASLIARTSSVVTMDAEEFAASATPGSTVALRVIAPMNAFPIVMASSAAPMGA